VRARDLASRLYSHVAGGVSPEAARLEAKRRKWLDERLAWILRHPISWALLAPESWPTTANVVKWIEWPAAQVIATQLPRMAESIATVKLTFEQSLAGAAWGHELHYLWPSEFEEPALRRFLKFLDDPETYYVPDYKPCGRYRETSEPAEIRRGLPVMARSNPHELGPDWWTWDWRGYLEEVE